MRSEERPVAGDVSSPAPAMTLEFDQLAEATDEELDAVFRQAGTLPLETLMNVGEHRVDVAARTIYNDAHWKGWLPKGLVIRDLFERLSTGYAKRFWKGRDRYLGETLYLQGRILVKHELEELTLETQTNDLAPGRYILLKYTDAVFEHIFYDIIRTLDDGTIVYRGYSGRYPGGKRGFTGLLRRRYGFAHMGVADHTLLSDGAAAPAPASLDGAWRLDVIATSNHPLRVGDVEIGRGADGGLTSRLSPAAGLPVLLPSFVLEHFGGDGTEALVRDLRAVDDRTLLGTWTTGIRGPYARLLLGGSLGLFHPQRARGIGRRFTMYYVLTRR